MVEDANFENAMVEISWNFFVVAISMVLVCWLFYGLSANLANVTSQRLGASGSSSLFRENVSFIDLGCVVSPGVPFSSVPIQCSLGACLFSDQVRKSRV